MDPETAAAVAVYVDQYAAASESAKAQAASAVALLWRRFDGWYRDRLVTEIAAQSADVSRTAQYAMVGASEQYVASVVAALRGDRGVSIAPTRPEPVRNGANLITVYSRPVETYRERVATSGDQGEAERLAAQRLDGLMRTDLLLTERQAQQQQMAAQNVTRFRRVVRPELSQEGTCGLCIAASDRVYKTGDLMPIHAPTCKCKTMPIVGDDDPGRFLNEEDLKRLYADAGSTKAKDLLRTRYKVDEHGEFGPVLTRRGDRHRGPDDVKPLEQDPERAARMLTKTLPVLGRLEERAKAGEDVAGPLAYQRQLVARLRRIAG